MNTWEIILEYVRAFTSAQIVIGVVVIFFFIRFKQDIRDILARLGTIKFPGGEISTQLQQTKAEKLESSKKPEAQDTPSLPQGLTLTPDQIKKVSEYIVAERANAYLWEYRYLNYFLVPHTQQVLDWFVSLAQSTSLRFYDSFWQPAIVSSQERKAILDALQQHHLIEITSDLIEITPKGKEYAGWRGPMPAAS
jgi:hypothetical protein